MVQNGTFEGGRGPTPGGAEGSTYKIHIIEPGSRGRLDPTESRFCIKVERFCMKVLNLYSSTLQCAVYQLKL